MLVSPKATGRPEDRLMSASVAFWNASSTSSFVTQCSAQCYTLPSGSSSRSQIIESNGMACLLLPCRIIMPRLDLSSQAGNANCSGDHLQGSGGTGNRCPYRWQEKSHVTTIFQTVAESVATIACTLLSDASIYINLVEHAARMECVTELAATVFTPSYRRAAFMPASLASLGFCGHSVACWGHALVACWRVASWSRHSILPCW